MKMAHDPRLQEIADILEGVKWNSKGFTACCPAHADSTPSLSVSLGDKVSVVYRCHAGCSQESVLKAVAELRCSAPVTTSALAEKKQLPLMFLKSLGIKDRKNGTVLIPYRLADGSFAPRMRLRKALAAKDGFSWLPGKGSPVPYGLERLAEEQRDFCLLVEGESDCWTLWHAGFPAIGIPGANMAKVMDAEYVAQFARLYIWREPDRGGDNFVAGITARLREIGFKGVVWQVRGADLGVKDPADLWKRDPAGFKSALHEAIRQAREIGPTESAVEESGGRLLLDPKNPMASARVFIEHQYTQDGMRTLIFHGGQLLVWRGGAYFEIESGDINAAGYKFLERACRRTRICLEPFKPNKALVSELIAAVKAEVHFPNEIMPPAWLYGEGSVPPRELIGVENGLLHLPSGRILPHSPWFFVRNVLPVPFVPGAEKFPEWNRFLRALFGADEELRNTLQEIFGYFLTPDTKQQKIFMLVGPKRAGKGVIGRVLTALLGRNNVCSPTLASLGTNFGLSTFVGKQLAIISDARLGSRVCQHQLVERLLSISGEDGVDIDRKYKEPLAGMRLSTRFLLMTNELPQIADTSGALASRFIILPLEESFYGREDHALELKLLKELPAILNWSIEGWKCLQKRGRFLQPSASDGLVREFEDLGSPVAAFIRECCETGPGYRVRHQVLFNAWRSWNIRQCGESPGSSQLFGRDLHAALPGLKVVRPREANGSQARYYAGLRLRS